MATKKAILELIDYLLEENVPKAKIYPKDCREVRKLIKELKKIDSFNQALLKSDYLEVNVRKNKRGSSYRVLSIVQWNGRRKDITKTAIKKHGVKFNKRAAVLSELRRLAEEDIKHYRSNYLMPHERGNTYHIDHVGKPFIQLAVEWVQSEGYSSFDSLEGRKYYNSYRLRKELQESWKAYHKKNAKLRAVLPQINLAESSRGYEAPF